MRDEIRVFVVDDDPGVLKAIERLLRSHGFTVEAFTSPSAFLTRSPHDGPGCLLLDLRMPELSGLDVQEEMNRRGIWLPIIFLSGKGDVPSTARAMRDGAVDFLVKPVSESELLDAIARARDRSVKLREERRLERDAEERFARLTKREREVCDLVAEGLLNKQIAYELGTSEKTVKVHRGRVMHKLEVGSVAALVRLVSNRTPRPQSYRPR
jgi:FixJ family two-component response regulator